VLHPHTPAEIAFSVVAIAITAGAVAGFTALVAAGMRARRGLQL
jgi:carbon starvation protein CstA